MKFQSFILSFLFVSFFRWRAIYGNACKGLYEGTESCWSPFLNVNLGFQSPFGVFCGIRSSLGFLAERRGITFVTHLRVHRKYYVSMYFLRKEKRKKDPSKEKRSCFREKGTIFPDNTRNIMSKHSPF